MRIGIAGVIAMIGLLVISAVGFAQQDPAKDRPTSVRFEWGVKIPMRDGVNLNATVYRAVDQTAALPCVFVLTPYISESAHARGMYFADNQYVFITVDSRGRGNSEGEFAPLLQEAKDGHDAVEWLAKQPWCNGKVAMWGGSYSGYDQWATAKEFPSGLTTIVPVASGAPGIDFPILNNLSYTYLARWLTLVSGVAAQDIIFSDERYWQGRYQHWFKDHAAFAALDQYIGNRSAIFQTWVQHPTLDAYWDRHLPTAEQYAGLSLPILTITGHYDGNQPGALWFYREHMRHGSSKAKASHYLIIGPWDHAGTRTPKQDVGGLTFGEASMLDMNALHKQWYDWTMKQGTKPEFLKDKVAVYMVGEEAWRYAATLEAITARTQTWYLDSKDGGANDIFSSGALRTSAPALGAPDRYVYDPLDTSSLAYDASSEVLAADYPAYTDQRGVLMSAGKQLVYHTPAFERDVDIAGVFRLSAFIALDQPDTDFSATIYEIARDGGSILLAQDMMRARYRKSLREQTLVTPGVIERYDFTHFNFTARRIAQGSRLRLVIAPVNSMHMQKNYNTGGVINNETGANARKVTVTLYHDAERPSALYVPIAAESSVPGG